MMDRWTRDTDVSSPESLHKRLRKLSGGGGGTGLSSVLSIDGGQCGNITDKAN